MRQTFDQSLVKIFERVQEIWSGHESVADGQIRSSGDKEETRNSRLNPITFSCDPDLESTWLSNGFCTPSQCDKHLTKVN